MAFSSFQSRLIAFISGLLALALAATFLAVNQAQIGNARRVIDADLARDAAVFRRLFAERTDHLLESARLLSGDFAFKAAYSTADRQTTLSAMENHLGRVTGAAVMLLISLDDRVLVDTGVRVEDLPRPNPWPALLAAAAEDDYGEAAGLVPLRGQLHQMVVVPLLSPDLEAWILIGFRIDQDYVRDLRRLTLSHVSILEVGDEAATVVAGTLPQTQLAALPAGLAASGLAAGQTGSVGLGGDEMVSSVLDLGRGPRQRILLVLQRSLDDELAPFRELRRRLLALFLFSLALAVVAAVAIARSVTRPVLELTEGARRIEAGDYGQRITLRRRDEIGALANAFNRMARGLAEKERVRDLLGKVVSREIAEELLRKETALGGEERVVSVLFSDVRNFTALCEGRPPADILGLLNVYLTEVSGVVERHGGVVDKYIGDAMMALFGAPVDHDDDASRAVAAALGMCSELERLNRGFADRGMPLLAIGVGIHTGLVVAGNMGSTSRLNYTVIGDAVNLASRLEGLTKSYGVPVLVSETTRRDAPGFVYRELDQVRVKGREGAVTLYQPLGRVEEVGEAARDELARFEQALAALRRGEPAAAHEAFSRLAAEAERVAAPEAALYRLFVTRAETQCAAPSDPPWDGTVDFHEK